MSRLVYPTGFLKPYIDYYYTLETDLSDDFAPPQRVYPYGTIIVVFHYQKPSFFAKAGAAPAIEPRSVICGQQTSYYDLAIAGKTGMIFIVFKPHAAGFFFKMPMSELKNENIALSLVSKDADEVEEKIMNACCLQKRIGIIERYLASCLKQNWYEFRRLEEAFKVIKPGNHLTVKMLAEASCLSVKQFERKFSAYVGLNPKEYLRISRFQRIMANAGKGSVDFVSLAFENGYYDQAHFIHDFKMFTGSSPAAFFEAGSNNEK